MAPHLEEGDWRPIVGQAGEETDPPKPMIPIGKLCCASEGERREKSRMAVIQGRMSQGPFSAIG
jgi:hypothetical protein